MKLGFEETQAAYQSGSQNARLWTERWVSDWVYCPNCHNQLQHTCPSCSKLVRNEWEICVYCGTEQAGAPQTVIRRPAANPFLHGNRPQPAPEADENVAYRPVRMAE